MFKVVTVNPQSKILIIHKYSVRNQLQIKEFISNLFKISRALIKNLMKRKYMNKKWILNLKKI